MKPLTPTKPIAEQVAEGEFDKSIFKLLPIDANKSFTLKTDWNLKGETYLWTVGNCRGFPNKLIDDVLNILLQRTDE